MTINFSNCHANKMTWDLYDPLGEGYFWIDVLEPVISLETTLPRKTTKEDRKLKARAIALQAIENARLIAADKDIRAVRVKQELQVMRSGHMKISYVFFRLDEKLKIIK